MEHDYHLLVENIKKRRYDEALGKPILSEGFETAAHPDCIRYALEAMQETDISYAYQVYGNARRIQAKISKELTDRGVHVEYRYQGALKTYTHVLLYGEVEMIVLKKNPSDKPHVDIQKLGAELMDILNGDPAFKSVDYTDKTRIRITALQPACEIGVLPSVWVNTPAFVKTKKEVYRGITEFDFIHKKTKKYLPFLNIVRINAKDQRLHGNLKALARLLLSLQKDHEEKINIRHSEINALLYAIPEEDLKVDRQKILSLLPRVERHLDQLAKDDAFFKSLVSPSEKERVFASRPEKKDELLKLGRMLHPLVEDIRSALGEKGLTLNDEISYGKS